MTMYYKDGFFDADSGDVPQGAVQISQDLYRTLIEGQAQSKQITTNEQGYPVLIEPQPSPYHTLQNGKWVIDEDKQAELRALKRQQLIKAIDDKATSIYSHWTRFESEYKARKAAAQAYKSTGYQGEVNRYISSFATPAGISNQEATDLILMQAAELQKLQDELAAQRMRKYELRRPSLSEEQIQVTYEDIIQQMDNLAEAYNNG